MDNIIIDNKLINKEQITKITYSINYDNTNGTLYCITPFLYFFESNGKNRKYTKSDGRWSDNGIDKEELAEMVNKKQKAISSTDMYNISGQIDAKIELSSGSEVVTEIFNFSRIKWFNWYKSTDQSFPFKQEEDGVEFKPEDIDIEYICDILFKKKKYQAIKKEI